MTTKPDLRRVWAEGAPGGNIEDPDVTSSGKFDAGWTAEIPPFENFNFLQQLFTQGLAHINEEGVAQWDALTDYLVGSLVKGSDGVLYRSELTPNIGNDPISSPVQWDTVLVSGGDLHTHSVGDGGTIDHDDLSGISPASSDHVTGGDSHDHSGGDGAVIPETALAAAVIAQLVTNGDSHDHSGGDGALIPESGLAAAVTAQLVTDGDTHIHDGLRTKIIDISDWNMDVTTTVNVTHGLTFANIRQVGVYIRNDNDTVRHALDYDSGAGVAGSFSANSVDIQLFRVAGGIFDSASYDSTTYNRGWVTILYVP